MDTLILVRLTLALHAQGIAPEAIVAALTALQDAPQTPASVPAPRPAARPLPTPTATSLDARGAIPSVAYTLATGMTADTIAALRLSPQQHEIAMYLLAHGSAGRRTITERLQHKTSKVTESALHVLRTRGVIVSQPIQATPLRQTGVRVRSKAVAHG